MAELLVIGGGGREHAAVVACNAADLAIHCAPGNAGTVPEDFVSPRQQALIEDIAAKTVNGMAAEGNPCQSVIYMGLMLANERGGDPVVIEYNARWGDPEAQVVFPLLAASGTNVHEMFYETARGRVPNLGPLRFAGHTALTVCLAAPGYPDAPTQGAPIIGSSRSYPNVTIQHGGTKFGTNGLVVAGGRVLYVTGQGETVDEAAAAAYAAIGQDGLHFSGMQYRTDIGHQARSKK